jgi:L-fuconolactonase
MVSFISILLMFAVACLLPPKYVPVKSENKEAKKLDIIDTHVHFFDPMRPTAPKRTDDKPLPRAVLPADLKALARPHGVTGVLIVEASPLLEDNQWWLDLAAKEPFIVGVVGRIDPASDDFEKNLRRFAKNPLYRGIRISHDELKAGLKGNLVERCKLLVELNLVLDVNGGPDLTADVARLAAEVPKLRIVINHAANLRIDGKEPPPKWIEGMAAAAKHPNVYCKVSALVEQTGKKPAPREVEYYTPVLNTLWKLFGEDRLLFGSNWPVSNGGAPYETVVGIVQDYFTAKGETAATKFFLGNSQTAYGWRPREITNTLGMKLVHVPSGTFFMGSPQTEAGREKEETQHEVELTKGFYLGAHEVTVGQFREFVKATKHQTDAEKDGKGSWGPNAVGKFVMDAKFTWKNPGFEQTDDHPVVNVSWDDAKAFCKWLSEKEKNTYRLPTEAEWEFTCRAGTTTAYWFGNDPEGLATAGNVADAAARAKFPAWTLGTKAKDGHAYTAPVGQFKANLFGLFDMHGNVWEWCEDWYEPKGYTTDKLKDPTGPPTGSARVQRGGGWSSAPHRARSASRVGRDPETYRGAYLGFRVLLTVG